MMSDRMHDTVINTLIKNDQIQLMSEAMNRFGEFLMKWCPSTKCGFCAFYAIGKCKAETFIENYHDAMVMFQNATKGYSDSNSVEKNDNEEEE